MKVLFFVPHLNTIYAGRTIYEGYKNAFLDEGHEFRFLSADDNQEEICNTFCPDILFTSVNSYILRFLDLALIKKFKKKGLKVFVNVPFWRSPFTSKRVNETPSLCNNRKHVSLIKSGDFGDVYYNISEQGDPRMDGFEAETGYRHYTIPLAADKSVIFEEYNEKFVADISFIGTNLPGRQDFMREQVFPLGKMHKLKIYGQDWTFFSKMLGNVQRLGQYFNIPILKNAQRPPLKLSDERKVYSSSTISINFHEDYQKRFGKDCSERTFKIPASGGFEIVDDVKCIGKYFVPNKEIVIAKNKKDWFEKIHYYLKNPEKRQPIIKAGKKRALKDHTYNNRVRNLLKIYKKL
jgi:spore maturation protein CgeB